MSHLNQYNQPIGEALPEGWIAPPAPVRQVTEGDRSRIEPLDPSCHASDLYAANQHDQAGESWTYMTFGPFKSLEDYTGWMRRDCSGDDPLYFAFIDKSNNAAFGLGAYLRIKPSTGSIEVGSIHLSPAAQRTPLTTEVMHLLMDHAFRLGYRRYEWKCDALNAPSRRAAIRLGFTFEGVFRQATHYKGRNRDTAWYAITDADWSSIAPAHKAWLDPSNFNQDGSQIKSMSAFMTKD